MNKYQEALKGLVETVRNNGCSFVGDCLKNGECKYNDAKLMCDDYVRFKTLQELVEKATPKKAFAVKGWDNLFTCPSCDDNFFKGNFYPTKYCPYCGQAIDWSKEDDC